MPSVGDFSQYLLHPENRRALSFLLHENGYDERLPESGWEQRRLRVEYERAFEEQLRHVEASSAAVGRSAAV
jgi:lipoprotein-releasing system permease protein